MELLIIIKYRHTKTTRAKNFFGEMSPFEKYCDYFTYKNESYERDANVFLKEIL